MFGKILTLLAVPLGWVAFKSISKANAATPAAGQKSFKEQGRSGTNWEVRFVKAFDTAQGRQTFWDIFLNGSRIMRYSQLGELKSSRQFIDSPLPLTDNRVRMAGTDFAVQPPPKA